MNDTERLRAEQAVRGEVVGRRTSSTKNAGYVVLNSTDARRSAARRRTAGPA